MSERPGEPRERGERHVLAGIAEVVRQHLGWEGTLSPEMRLVEDLRLDSIRLLTLAAEIENRFQVLLFEEDEAGIETVGDLIGVVSGKLNGKMRGKLAG